MAPPELGLSGSGSTRVGPADGPAALAPFLFAIVTVLLAGKIGAELVARWNQPAVLGELLAGIAIGNLGLVGVTQLQWFKADEQLALAAEIGVLLLLFEVGLESRLEELLAVGRSAVGVATLGVGAPMALGWAVSFFSLPESPWYVHVFVGATLAATSVGITARVLKDLGRIETGEARVILGAAVVDDVLALVLLAIVTGLIASVGHDGEARIAAAPILITVGKAVSFLIIAIVAGRLIARLLFRVGSAAMVRGMPIVLSVCYCFLVAGAAELMGLAPIVGAFAAGLVLNEAHYRGYTRMCARRFQEVVAPLSAVLTPVFFVVMGLKVDLRAFASIGVLVLAAGLMVAAVLGKLLSGLGVLERQLSRLAVGVGMIPRGEVGLIFVGIGASLQVGGEPILSASTLSALVFMVMATTLVTPPLLKVTLVGTREGLGAGHSARVESAPGRSVPGDDPAHFRGGGQESGSPDDRSSESLG
jgi:Kef-type K+ transport system membrane component KefB